jgi:hypothetical protein
LVQRGWKSLALAINEHLKSTDHSTTRNNSLSINVLEMIWELRLLEIGRDEVYLRLAVENLSK